MGRPPQVPGEFREHRRERELFAWSLLAGVLLLAALAGPFFAGRIYTRDDLGGYHLPLRAFYAEQLARGEPFDWMPQLCSGLYLTGEGQAGTYHPWHLLVYRWLPLRAALGWEWLAAYPFLLAGTWFFFRRRLGRRDAAMLGSLLFTFGSFNLLHFVHPNAVGVVAQIPWLLWTIDIVLIDSSRRKVAAAQAGMALLTGSQLLLGYPQYVWISLVAEVGYAGFLLVSRRRAPRDGCDGCLSCDDCAGCSTSPWPRLVIAKGTGLLVGAVQLFPTLDALMHSTRQSADAAALAIGSLHPLNLVQLVAPYFFTDRVLGGNTHELSVYIGAVPLMLVIWFWLRRGETTVLGSLARAAAGLAALSLVLAMGQYGGLYRLQTYVPLIGRFRCPCRYLVLFQLCIALLAAAGFAALERENRRQRAIGRPLGPTGPAPREMEGIRRQAEAFGAVVFVSVAVALAGLLMRDRPMIASVPCVLAGPVLMAVAAALVVAAARGVRGALVGLILFGAADLGCYGLSYAAYEQTDHLDHFIASAICPTPAPQREMPGQESADRVFAPPLQVEGTRLWTGNQMLLAGWRRADGYTGLEPQRQLDYSRPAALRVASVRWVRRDKATRMISGLTACNDDWLEVPDPLPRVRFVAEVVASDDPGRDIERIDVRRAALCEYSFALPPGRPGRASVTAERPGRIEVAVQCPSPQLLVIAESFHAGWRATVDGTPRPVVRANGDFLGCLVGPEDSLVVLEFQPGSLRRGQIASVAGLCLVLCCFAGGLCRRKRRFWENSVS